VSELVFLKLGGSVITDKRSPRSLRRDTIVRLGREIRAACMGGRVRTLIGHGGGSFAHVPAHKHRVKEGLPWGGRWQGYWHTRRAVMDLNARVVDALADGGLRVHAVQPSASALARDGALVRMESGVIQGLLDAGERPMVFGDAILDESLGFTIISTEDLFSHLARRLRPRRMVLACDVQGVFTADPRADPQAAVIPRIASAASTRPRLGGSPGTDVTGGMMHKVTALCALARACPECEVRIVSGLVPGVITDAIAGRFEGGTVIEA